MRGESFQKRDHLLAMADAGFSVGRMAQAAKLSKQQVRYRLRREGVDPRLDKALPPVPSAPIIWTRKSGAVRKFHAAEDARLLELEGQGLTPAQIARELKRHPGSIRARLEFLALRDAREEFQQGIAA